MLLFQAACVTITLLVGIRCGVPTTTLTPFTNPSPTTYLYYLPTYLGLSGSLCHHHLTGWD